MKKGSSCFAMLTLALIVPCGSSQAQDTQYAQGLFLDYYVIQNPDDVNEPVGRSMATLVDTSAPHLSYLNPFEIEPALKQFQDKAWGLHWTGFLKINEAGPHSLNLLVNTTAEHETRESHAIRCQSWLKIQNKVLASHELQWFNNGNQNAYGDIDLRPGIYDFEVWFACNDIGHNTTVETTQPSITINMRGPNDPMLKPIPKNQLLHEL